MEAMGVALGTPSQSEMPEAFLVTVATMRRSNLYDRRFRKPIFALRLLGIPARDRLHTHG